MQIILEKYSQNWKSSFEIEKKKLKSLLPFNIEIEHIGSTAIEGMIAKPIIDILVGVESEELFYSAINILQKHSYIYYSIYNNLYPDRRHFVKVTENHSLFEIEKIEDDIVDRLGLTRIFHIHVTEYDSAFWRRHLLFRDCIKQHKDLKERYSNLKLSLSKKDWLTLQDYAEAKTDFIRKIEKQYYKNS